MLLIVANEYYAVRMAFEYKNIPYKTSWLEFPDIKPTLISFGLDPNPESSGDMPYTVPTVKLPSGGYIMESYAIIKEIERLHPEPSLHLNNGYYDRTYAILQDLATNLIPEILPRIPLNVIYDESMEYFQRTRKEMFGMSLADLLKSDKAGENAWTAAKPAIKNLETLLTENSSGPFIDGVQVSYADFLIAAVYIFFEMAHKDSLERLMAYGECFQRHYKACRKWMTQNDS
jgi:glutathione S-transferase